MNIRIALTDELQLRNTATENLPLEIEWYGAAPTHTAHDDEPLENPVIANVLQMIKRLVCDVDQMDFGCREHFQATMSVLGWLGVSESDLSSVFGTTPNAVNRWMNGRSAPTPVLRGFVVQVALEMLRRDGFKMFGKRFHAITGAPNDQPEPTPRDSTISPKNNRGSYQ